MNLYQIKIGKTRYLAGAQTSTSKANNNNHNNNNNNINNNNNNNGDGDDDDHYLNAKKDKPCKHYKLLLELWKAIY